MSIFSVFKDKKFEKLINNFDTSFSNIPIMNNNDFSDNQVGQAIQQAITSSNSDSEIHSLFTSLSVSNNRLARYSTYDELFSAVQLIKRIIILYLNNVLQRDPITNKTILVKATEESIDLGTSEEYINYSSAAIKFFDFEDKLRSIILPSILKYGDSFVEILNLDDINVQLPKITPKKNDQKQKLLTEQEFLTKLNLKNNYNQLNLTDISQLLENYIEITDKYTLSNTDKDVEILGSRNNLIEESLDNSNNSSNVKRSYNFSNVLIKYHRPHNIIPLLTEFDNILGYVEIQETQTPNDSNNKSNSLVNFANVINQISATSYIGGDTKTEKKDNVIKMFVDTIILKLFNDHNISASDKFKTETEYSDHVRKQLKDDLFSTVKKLIISSSANSLFQNKLKVRYISSNNMFHFKNPGTGSFAPYGDSIIDPLIFPGKLYLLTQLSNAVTRLSRSSIMRKWTIETGSREDVNGLLQKLKKNLKNQRVTGEDIATSKNLPNILSDYKDMVTFKKKGQTFIDLDVLNSGDPRINIQDLEDLRKELISLSGVPSSYLGYQDVSDLAVQLANTNVVFANEISSIQKDINDNLTLLVARIGSITKFKHSSKLRENVQIGLIPPSVLVLQSIEASLTSINNIMQMFIQMPEIDIDPFYLLKRYCPMVNWDEFKKEAEDFKQRKKVSSPDTNSPPNPYGGM